jgi:AMIN domain
MKTAMKLTTGILAVAITVTAGTAFAQNTDAIDNARSIAKSLQQKQENDTNAALDAAGVKAQSKPAPGAPAPAVKPVVIPAVIPAAKPAVASVAPAPKPVTASAQHNQLQKVNVVPAPDSVKVEISSSQAVTPRVSKLSSPARIVVELPETVVASAQNKISVGSNGVKGVRIGMDGKTPPTTSVVVDLDKALAYDLTPSADGKLVLTLHTQDAAASAKAASSPMKPAPAPVVAKAAPAPKASKPEAAAVKPVAAPKGATIVAESGKPAPAPKVAVAKAEPVKLAASAPKPEPKTVVAAKPVPAPAVAPAQAATPDKATAAQQPKPQDKKWAMSGKRDPFFSPVVQQQGSGCSTGKKCLEIGGINLRGVVKSENGFIAVVTNNLGKAYFLRENDPVFNGFVVKITGDSVTFSETIQDKLGKPFNREVVKKIFTPAV